MSGKAAPVLEVLARHLALDAPKGALELAHSRLARVATHDGLQSAAAQLDVAAAQAGLSGRPRDQVRARDRQLLGHRVAAEVDHFEAVVQRVRDALDVVGGGDEEHAAEVVLAFEVVVAKARVVRRVEDFHESRRRVAAPVAVELVDLVEQHDRVVHSGFGEALQDAPGHRPDVGTAMPTDLGLIAHPAEGDTREGPAQGVGDRLGHAALAGAGWAGEAQDGSRMVGAAADGRACFRAHLADGQILEDAVLDVLETAVRALQMPGDRGHVDVGGRQLAPGRSKIVSRRPRITATSGLIDGAWRSLRSSRSTSL